MRKYKKHTALGVSTARRHLVDIHKKRTCFDASVSGVLKFDWIMMTDTPLCPY